MADPGVVPIEQGFLVQDTPEYRVEVWRMLFNWRLVVLPPGPPTFVYHGYCYFGTDLESLARAIAAGLEWADPINTAPEGFNKKAF